MGKYNINLFGIKSDDNLTEMEKIYQLVKNNKNISDENKNFILNLLDSIKDGSKNNPFNNEEELIIFIKVIIGNIPNANFESVFNDASILYNSLNDMGYNFNHVFLPVFYKNGLYDKGLFDPFILSVFEYSDNYFQVMNEIIKDENNIKHFDEIKRLIINLALFTPNDQELKVSIINFLEQYSITGDITSVIDNIVDVAKKKAGIYDNLDEDYLLKLQRLTENINKVFGLAEKEAAKIKEFNDEISSSRRKIDELNASIKDKIDRFDSTLTQIASQREANFEDTYYSTIATLKNEADELKKALKIYSEQQIKLLIDEAVKKMHEEYSTLIVNTTKANKEYESIKQLKEEARNEVKTGLEEIKKIVGGIGSLGESDISKLTELIKNVDQILPAAGVTAVSQQIVNPTNVINSASIRSNSEGIEIPDILPAFDLSKSIKERFNLILDRKKRNEDKGIVYHEKMDDVIYAILRGNYVYLWGPSGTGKSYFVEQLGELFENKVVDIGYITAEYEIIGGRDANGNYMATPFYDCYRNGYFAFCDEWDNSVSQAAIKLNSFMNKHRDYYKFPAIGFVNRHPNFRIIYAGNTKGMGGTEAYIRSKMDESIQQRVLAVKIDFDPKLEASMLNNYSGWLEFVTLFREALNNYWANKGEEVQGQITTRDLGDIVEYLEDGVWTVDKILDYRFIQTKEDDCLAALSQYIKSHDSKLNKKGKELAYRFVDLSDRKNG